jgi:hypothetical protein
MITEVCAKYDEDYICKKIDIILHSESFLEGKIRGLAGYLIEALKKDYSLNKSSKTVMEERRENRDAIEKEKQKKLEAEEKEKENQRLFVNKKISEYLHKLSENQRNCLHEEFEIFVLQQDSVLKSWYQKHGLTHPAIKAAFHNFLKKYRSEEMGFIASMEANIVLLE